MAKKNPCDVLTGDWNPIIGCERYSKGCKNCWFLDSIYPWQKRLGNIPETSCPNLPTIMYNRLSVKNLKTKRGIVGVCQHGDLFWDKVDDFQISQVLNVIDQVAKTKTTPTVYVFWTKRVERAVELINKHYRLYDYGVPKHIALVASVEDQQTADERIPHLMSFKGTKILAIEPMLGPIDLTKTYKNGRFDTRAIDMLDWVLVGSETGTEDATPIDLDWVRSIRDQAKSAIVPLFIKQLGNSHKKVKRLLDGRTWDEFPRGFVK